MFFSLFGYWARGGGVSPKGLVHTQLVQFFTQKWKFFKLFFDAVITQNEHSRYVRHVSGRIHVFFTLFAIGCGGGGVKRDWKTTYLRIFAAYLAQKSKFLQLIFFIPLSKICKAFLAPINVLFTLLRMCVALVQFCTTPTCRKK